MAHFSEILKDSGLLDSTPPFLVIPDQGIGLVFLIGVKALSVRHDLKFDRTNLSVTVVNSSDLHGYLMEYSNNFPSNPRMMSDILALAGPPPNSHELALRFRAAGDRGSPLGIHHLSRLHSEREIDQARCLPDRTADEIALVSLRPLPERQGRHGRRHYPRAFLRE